MTEVETQEELKLLYFPDDRLRKQSEPVDMDDPETIELGKRLEEFMMKQRALGVAAPQVGIHKRVVVVYSPEGNRVLFNPDVVSEREETEIDSEGCLSVPFVSGNVERPAKIGLRAYDLNGEQKTVEVEGLLAREILHEIDHLEGVLFTDRMSLAEKASVRGALKDMKDRYERDNKQPHKQQKKKRKKRRRR